MERSQQIGIKIGNRPPEAFTEDEVTKLVMIAEKWQQFCLKQPQTAEEKEAELRPCARCPFIDVIIDPNLCVEFQEFSKMRMAKLNRRLDELDAKHSETTKEREFIINLKGFLEGKGAKPEL